MSRPVDPPSRTNDIHRNEGPQETSIAAMDTAAALQQLQLQSADADAPAAATSSSSTAASPFSHSPAQRCATDTLAVVFGFLPFEQLPATLRVCRQWHAAARKEKAREGAFNTRHDQRLAAILSSGSPLCRHIRHLWVVGMVGLATFRGLAALCSLTSLSAGQNATELTRLLEECGPQQALVELRATFPPGLRQLDLQISPFHSKAVCQLLLDALPAMSALEEFALNDESLSSYGFESMSLEPLLKLPHLTSLDWLVDGLSVAQLQTIKQIPLRHFASLMSEWSLEQLIELCRPPHRLQQLEGVTLWQTICGEAVMAELLHLSGLTSLDPRSMQPSVLAFLPRFPRLQRLSIRLSDAWLGRPADVPQADAAALLSALSACSALTNLTFEAHLLTESLAVRLLQAVPLLRFLCFKSCAMPSLRFLRAAPQLDALELIKCGGVRPGHVVSLGSFAPQLQRLKVERCVGLHLDETERQLLTPPGAAAVGLPQLHKFEYRAAAHVVMISDDEDDLDNFE